MNLMSNYRLQKFGIIHNRHADIMTSSTISRQTTSRCDQLLPWIYISVDERRCKQEVEVLGEVWTWQILITSIIICSSHPIIITTVIKTNNK